MVATGKFDKVDAVASRDGGQVLQFSIAARSRCDDGRVDGIGGSGGVRTGESSLGHRSSEGLRCGGGSCRLGPGDELGGRIAMANGLPLLQWGVTHTQPTEGGTGPKFS